MKKRFLLPLCLALIPAAACASLEITVSWQDDAGMPASVQAVELDAKNYWARLSAQAPIDGLQLHCSDPEHPDWLFNPADGTTLQNVTLATDLGEGYGQIINAYGDGRWIEAAVLYLSTLESPVQPQQAATETVYVPVYCRTVDGVMLGETTAECKSGMPNHVFPPILEGYTAVSGQQVDVTVHSDRTFFPQDLWFDYMIGGPTPEPEAAAGKTRPPETAVTPVPTPVPQVRVSVPVVCRDQSGQLLSISTVECSSLEDNIIVPPEMDGWIAFVAQPVHVAVDAEGAAVPAEVTFIYEPAPKPVIDVSVEVLYQLEDGKAIGNAVHTFRSDEKSIIAAPPVTGYHILGEDTVVVEADEDGQPVPASVTFVYQPDPQAVVTVRHVDESGADILAPETVSIIAGCSAVIEPGNPPQGWSVFWAEPVAVTASADGKADREEVSFIYRRAVQDVRPADGEYVNRFGLTNSSQVAVRHQPSNKSSLATGRVSRGTAVWVIMREVDESGTEWSHILVNGVQGYTRSEFIDEMTRLESDIYEYERQLNMPRYPLE